MTPASEAVTPRPDRVHAEWATPEALDRLRALWAGGASMSDIAGLLNTGKNAIAGKARRMRLPPRPSPIHKRCGHSVHWCGCAAARETAAAGHAERRAARAVSFVPLPGMSAPPESRPAPRPAPTPRQVPARPAAIPRSRSCLWPSDGPAIGDGPAPSRFIFVCEETPYGTAPYCPDHYARAYAGDGWRHTAMIGVEGGAP